MLPDRVSNPGPLTYESGALPIALRGLALSANKLSSIATSPLEWFYSNSVSKVMLNAAAKSSCFNVPIIKNSIPVVEDGANKKGLFFK